ncbi:hypothetical protein NQ315_008597 [Exocentrus adspersus]|uniref:TROVE domain-containing protein n=1 Tax=Exocentrus adspersus TaxID=1586481 RepID=A0AAV8W681_9CUCU|nr:hypothetical protein NQ315_008597 [Exocentrus adspersus]
MLVHTIDYVFCESLVNFIDSNLSGILDKSKGMAASKLTNEEKLKRLIYINNTSAKYVCGGPDKYVSLSSVIAKRDLLDEFLRNSPKTFFKTILSTSEDKLLPHRATLHYVLASALTSEEATAEIKHEVCETVLKICKSDQDFFDFIKYVSSLKVHKKLPPTVLKAIRKFYKNKSSLDLANSYARSTSYHTWSYKDLIKLGHNVVINFILTKKAPDSAGDNEKIQVLNILNKSETLRKTKDHKVAVPIIAELKATINQVQSSLRKSAEVWNAVLPNMTLSQVLQVLPKLYKLGFLKKRYPHSSLGQ